MKKKKSSGGGANWMDTYGDMVTLLLCFFVLLYSMSTIDQEKWMIIVQSFNKDAIVSTDDTPRGPEGSDGKEGGNDMPMTQDEVETAMDDLFQYLAEYAAQQQDSAMTVSQGDGYVFISFNDAIFFDGDSYVLRADGREALDGIIPALSEAGPYVDQLRVLGHTAQASAHQENNPNADRFLASNRATVVLLYLQENIDRMQLNPARLIAENHGQWLPIAPNDTSENRSRNRRVELIITGKDIEENLSDSITQYYTMSETPIPEGVMDTAPAAPETGTESIPGDTTTTTDVTTTVEGTTSSS